jgi:hypothetical protein
LAYLLCPSINEYDPASLNTQLAYMTASHGLLWQAKSPRTSSVRKLASFDIRSIPKKPPAPSLAFRRSRQAMKVHARAQRKSN